MSYPVYHGIQLAQSSEIHNLNVQTLAQTAIDAITNGTQGRLVFDTDSQTYKYWKLDENGAPVLEEVTSVTMHNALQALVDIINGDGTTEGSFRKAIADVVGTTPESLDTLQEIATALNNDPDLYNTITALITSNIEAAKNEIRGAVSENFDTLEEIEAKLNDLTGNTTTGLATETADRIAGDAALQTELDATQVGAGLGNDGSYTVDTAANFISAASSLRDADLKLDTSLQTEKDRALAAESALDGRISAVEGAAGGGKIGDLTTLHTDAKDSLVNATNEVHDDVVTEKTRAEGAEATLDAKINQAIADRKAQDDVIEASIGLNSDGTFDGSLFIGGSMGIWSMQGLGGGAPPTNLQHLTFEFDNEIGMVRNSMLQNWDDYTNDRAKFQSAIGLSYYLDYLPDSDANYISGATSVSDATTMLDSQIKVNTDGLAAEVAARIAMDGNITDSTGLNADGSYKGAGVLLTKIAAPSDLHSAVEGLASMINQTMMPALGIQTAAGTTTGAVDQSLFASFNYIAAPNSIPDALEMLDNQIKVNSDDIVEEAAIRAAAINAGRQAVGLNTDGTYSPVAGANYVAAATTVKNATELLDAQIKANYDAIAQESSDRAAAVVTVQSELDATQSGAGLGTDGAYTAKADANYIAAATSLKAADNALDAALKTEVDRSTAEDDAIKARVDALEAQDAGTNMGDLSGLQTDVKDSLVGAINEVDTQQGSIASAVGLTETPAVGGSNFSIDLTSTNYVNSATSVQGAIVGLDTQVKTIDDAHKASWFTYKSTAGAATNHLVQHNLNSEFVEVQLWVKNPDDGKYRMDIAEVIEHDFNSIEVVMNAARDIKVIVEKRYA